MSTREVKNEQGRQRNERFCKVIKWILSNRLYRNQKELAAAAGTTETTLSRIKNGGIIEAEIGTLMKINAAVGNVINIDYIQGKSDVMLVKDLTDEERSTLLPVRSSDEYSSYVNAALASKDETIEALKSQAADKDILINELREQIADKRREIADKDHQIYLLRKELAEAKNGCDYHFPIGVAEPGGEHKMTNDTPDKY